MFSEVSHDLDYENAFLAKDPLGFTGTYAISLADCYEEDMRDTYSHTYK